MGFHPTNEQLNQAIDRRFQEAVEFLQELVRIPSVAGEAEVAEDGTLLPFGNAVARANRLFMARTESMGFRVSDAAHYMSHAELGDGDRVMGIIGHLDVVPAGEKSHWSFDPFCGEVKDDELLGRGTTDDKGPMVAVLFAIQALLDTGWKPDARIRLMAGLDEETMDWKGLDMYQARFNPPDYGFTPDGVFPLVHGEKGIINFDLAHKIHKTASDGLILKKLEGGSVRNAVPASARALLGGLDQEGYAAIIKKAEQYADYYDVKLKARKSGKSLQVTASGKAAHAAAPSDGVNAISILLRFLGELDFVNDDINEFLEFYNCYLAFREDGRGLGCAMTGKYGDRLTFNVGLIKFDKEAVSVACEMRYPVDSDAETLYSRIGTFLDEFHIGIVRRGGDPTMYLPPESPIVQAMLKAYRGVTGDLTEPVILGGGTYAKAFPNMLAFGAQFMEDPDRMHMADERLPLHRFKQMIAIYARAIEEMADADFALGIE